MMREVMEYMHDLVGSNVMWNALEDIVRSKSHLDQDTWQKNIAVVVEVLLMWLSR